MRLVPMIIVLCLGLSAGPGHTAEGLKTITSKRLQMPLEYWVDGVVEARQQATLSAEVVGKIESVNFDVDDFVEQGQVVLTIRDREYRAQQQKAIAALEEAKANLQDTQLEFRRNKDLRKQKLISQAVLDKASANLKAAKARADSAQANLAQAEEQARIARMPRTALLQTGDCFRVTSQEHQRGTQLGECLGRRLVAPAGLLEGAYGIFQLG